MIEEYFKAYFVCLSYPQQHCNHFWKCKRVYAPVIIFFGSFVKNSQQKMLGIVVWEDNCTQSLVKPVFYFRMDDKKIFELLFETEGNLKLIWRFSIYLVVIHFDCARQSSSAAISKVTKNSELHWTNISFFLAVLSFFFKS